jgi:hypothetical protein
MTEECHNASEPDSYDEKPQQQDLYNTLPCTRLSIAVDVHHCRDEAKMRNVRKVIELLSLMPLPYKVTSQE